MFPESSVLSNHGYERFHKIFFTNEYYNVHSIAFCWYQCTFLMKTDWFHENNNQNNDHILQIFHQGQYILWRKIVLIFFVKKRKPQQEDSIGETVLLLSGTIWNYYILKFSKKCSRFMIAIRFVGYLSTPLFFLWWTQVFLWSAGS